MEVKTKIKAEAGKQEIHITRDFELPVELLFKAYTTADIVAEWMGTKVLKLENKMHGGYQFETTDPMGNKHHFHGAVHQFIKNQIITRTFEIENSDFGPQLEFLEFEKVDAENSRLTMHVVYRSVEIRDRILKLPFAQGINMAHNRLQQTIINLKNK